MSIQRISSRRQLLQSAAAFGTAAAVPASAFAAPASADITGRLARYMASARERAVPADVAQACKHRILDTFGAMISGARM